MSIGSAWMTRVKHFSGFYKHLELISRHNLNIDNEADEANLIFH